MMLSRDLPRALLMLVAFLAAPDSASAQRRPLDKDGERLSVTALKEKDAPQDTKAIWCYDIEPMFIFLQRDALVISDLEFNMRTLANLDRASDVTSLVCSEDGKVISFLSASHDRLYIYQNDHLSIYELAASPLTKIRFGSLMSPDGSTFAVPGNVRHVNGPQSLQTKRVVRVSSADVFWISEHFIVRTKGDEFSIRSFRSLQQTATWRSLPNTLADGFYACGERSVFLLESDDADDRSLWEVTLRSDRSGGVEKGKKIIANVGTIESSKGSCVVSTAKENELGVSVVDRIVLLRGRSASQIAVDSLILLNDAFSISKDATYLVTFQSNVMQQRGGGRIIIMKINR
jgi:hypothetical protein